MNILLNRIYTIFIAFFLILGISNCTGNSALDNKQMSKGYKTYLKKIGSFFSFKTKKSQVELDLKFYKNFDSFIDGFSNRAIKSDDIKNIITNYYDIHHFNLNILLSKCFPIKDSVICSILTNKNFNFNFEYFSKLFLKSCFLIESQTHKILLQPPYSFKVEDIYTSNNSYKKYIIHEKYNYFKDTLKLPISSEDKLKKEDIQLLWEYNIYEDINQYIKGETLINLTGKNGDIELFKKLYFMRGINIFSQNQATGATVLDVAAAYGQDKFIEFLSEFLSQKKRYKLGKLSNENTMNALWRYSDNEYSRLLSTHFNLIKNFNLDLNQKFKGITYWEHILYGSWTGDYKKYFNNFLKYPIETLGLKITEDIIKTIKIHNSFPDTSPTNKYKNVSGGPSKYAILEYLYKQKQKQLYPEKTNLEKLYEHIKLNIDKVLIVFLLSACIYLLPLLV